MLDRSVSAPALAFLAIATGVLPAQSGPFAHPDGTPHHYQVVAVPAPGLTFDEALAAAAQAGGHLATITSAAEATFVFALADRSDCWVLDPASGSWDGPWIGGHQNTGAQAPADGWDWNELEPFAFTDWSPGQPDDDGGSGADRLHLGGATTGRSAQWGDRPAAHRLPAYVIEFAGPRVLRTGGLIADEAPSHDGYVLISALFGTGTWLIDTRGRVIEDWQSQYTPGTGIYLRNNGNLLRAGNLVNPDFAVGGRGGIVEEFDWDGNLVWSFQYSSNRVCLHHDLEELPNGNILMIAWERIPGGQAIAAGRDPALLPEGELWPDKILEVDRAGQIVWEWRVWDHLIQDFDPNRANYGDPAQHPGRIDLNYAIHGGEADWQHSNSIAYDPGLDQIALSVRSFDELWIIDHSTTTAEAAGSTGGRSGRGGELLYRWGNPRAYRAGTLADQRLFKQHDVKWIRAGLPGAGDLLVFNNGTGRPGGDASTVDEIVTPTPDAQGNYPRSGASWGPAAPSWSFGWNPPAGLYSMFVSGAERLPSGNTLVCAGWIGALFEVDPSGTVVWQYRPPLVAGAPAVQGSAMAGNGMFRAPVYQPDFPGFAGRDLSPGEPIEAQALGLLADGSTLRRRIRPGSSVELSLRAGPALAGQLHIALASATPGLLRLDQRHLGIAADSLTLATIQSDAPAVFEGYIGVLDPNGLATARFHVPPVPGLVGLEFLTAFLVVDPAARSGVGFMSNTVTVEIVD
jgi:hypothetical protein